MRKIFALSLIACLALSGAAFGVEYYHTNATTADEWAKAKMWSNSATGTPLLPSDYPGKSSSTDNATIVAADGSSMTILASTPITIKDLTVTGASNGNDLIPQGNLIVTGTLTLNSGNFGIYNIAKGVNVDVAKLTITAGQIFLQQATGVTDATFTLGGITFTPFTSGVYTKIASGTAPIDFIVTDNVGTASGIATNTKITIGTDTKLAAPTTATNSPTFVTSEKQTLQLLGAAGATLPIPAGNPIVLNGGSIADASATAVLTGNARLTTAPTATTDTYALSSTAGSKAIAFNAGAAANKTYVLDIEDKVTLDGTLTPVKNTTFDATLTITGGTIANDKHTIKIGAANSAVVLGSAKGASLAANKYEGITINSADLSGTVAIEGTVSADTLTVASTGDVTLSGDVTLKGATVNGKATLNGNVTLLDAITATDTTKTVTVNIAGVTDGKLDVFTFTNDASVISLDATTPLTAASIASNDKGVLTFTGAQIKDVKEVKAGAKVVLDTGTTLEVDKDNDLNIYGTLTLANSVAGAAATNAGNFKMAKGDNPQVFVSKDAILALNDNVALSITGSTGNNDQGISKLTVYGTLEFDNANATITGYKNLILDGATIVVSQDSIATPTTVTLGRANTTDDPLAPKGDLTIDLKTANDVAKLTDGIEVASGKTLTIKGLGSIYVETSNAFDSTNTRSYYIDVKDGGTLSIGNNAKVPTGVNNGAFPIKLAGTLAPNELPITATNGLTLTTIASTAKLDLDALCLAEIKAGNIDKVVYASDIKDVINGFHNGTNTAAITASATADDAAILEEKGTRILFQLRDGNEFGLDVKNTSGDAITYYIPVTVTYDSLLAGGFTLGLASDDIVSTDLKVYSGTTSDTPVTPDPGTGTTTAITVDAIAPEGSGEKDANGAYTVTTTATTVDFKLPTTSGDKTTLDYTNAACTATITRGTDNETVTRTIKDGKVSIPVATNDEFTVKFTFTKVTTGEVATAADATVTTGATKVIVNGGALTPYITANGKAFSKKDDAEIKISVTKWEHKFTTVTVANESYTVALKGETGTVVPAEKAAYTANAAALKAGTYTYKASAVYTPEGATEAATVADIPVEFTVNDDGGDTPGTGGNGGGGGCSAGVASLALLLAIPMLLKRK